MNGIAHDNSGKIRPNFIAGEWVYSETASLNHNPSDLKDIVGEFAGATREQVGIAVQSAAEAAPSWGKTSPQIRSECLDRIGTELVARKEELGALLSREEGKTLPEGIAEVVRAGQIFKYFSGEALRCFGEHGLSVRLDVTVDVSREPVGVVGVVTPWNFPIAIPAWKIAPALAFGNAVVFKPAELVPASAWALADIISRSGIPAGTFNLVMGKGSIAGEALVDHPKLDALTFTGSVATGRKLAIGCATRGKKFQLEMGGKNPMVVLDDADLAIAVPASINGAFYSTGQRCTASSRLIVTAEIHDRFVHELEERMARLRVGHALDPQTQIGPVASRAQLAEDLEYVEIGKKEGAKLLGGKRVTRQEEGYYLTPALFTETSNAMRINQEEIFGPVASVIRVRNYEEALATANDTLFGLSSGICTTSLKYAQHFKANSSAGMVMVNLPTAGVDFHVPFGGRKNSSHGPREQGRHAIEFYTSVKTSYTAG